MLFLFTYCHHLYQWVVRALIVNQRLVVCRIAQYNVGHIYDEPQHALINKWLLLTNPAEASDGAKGFLKICAAVIGPRDDAPVCIYTVVTANPHLASRNTVTRWKVWESTNPRESVFVANTWQHLPHLLFCGPLVPNFPKELFCKQSPVYGVFWPLLPHPSTDRNEIRTVSSLSPRNLRIKFGANPSTICLVIVVTDRHTDTHTQTNAGESIFPWFRGDNKFLYYYYPSQC